MSVRTVAQTDDTMMLNSARPASGFAVYRKRDVGYFASGDELQSSRGLVTGLVLGAGAWVAMLGVAALTLQLL